MYKIGLLVFISVFQLNIAIAQLIQISPENPNTNSNITVTFDASEGNSSLLGFSGDVYTYTGVITSESFGDWDWKHVRNDWGVVNPNTLMTKIGDDLYQISFNIRDFYQIEPDEVVLKLAFLFHNEDYSLVARTEDGGDILVEINKQTPGSYVSHELIDEKLVIAVEGGIFEIQFFTNDIVKAEFVSDLSAEIDTTFTVIALPHEVDPFLTEDDESLSFKSSELEVFITKSPVRLHYVFNGDTLLSESNGFEPNIIGGRMSFFNKSPEMFYGAGSRAIPINRRGEKLKIYNEAHYGYGNSTPTLNISIPFVVSTRGYGLFFDNRYPAYLDLDSEDNQQTIYTAEGGRLRYYFIAGFEPDDIMQGYTHLTGKQKLPPVWALGYIQSKYGYQTETEARSVVNKIRQNDFPLDALILDLYWFGSTNDMGNLDWNYGQWPEPEAMMSDFAEQGIKTILITEPYFTLNSTNYSELASNNYLAQDSEGNPYILWGFWAGDAALLDITQPDAQEWMWNFYRSRRDEGVGGWWSDLGEPETHPWDMEHSLGDAKSVHNIYSLLWAKLLDEKYNAYYPNERLFNLSRSGYAGMQRYSTFPWSGDIQRSFSGLQAQIPIMLGAGMSGLGYMHSDVGGFTGADNDAELFTRWVQFGTFAPILRMHGVGTTEPVNFVDPYRSIMRKYIKLRYQLLPYNYTLAYENSAYGSPLARQLNYYEPQNSNLSDINDSYLWGKNFLVAPILERSISQRTVVFPDGKWLNYHNLAEYQGGTSYSVSCNINDIPLFVRAGSFIPTVHPMQSTSEYDTDSLVIKYFPDPDVPESYGYIFADDCQSTYTIDNQEYELLHFNGTYSDNELTINLFKTGSYQNAPLSRNVQFEVHRIAQNPDVVEIDGVEVNQVGSTDDFQDENPAFFWDESSLVLHINCSWEGSPRTIRIANVELGTHTNMEMFTDEFLLHNPWPNPFSDNLTISADITLPGIYSFSLQSSTGINIVQFSKFFSGIGGETFTINLRRDMPSGIYFLLMSGRTGSQVKRLVKI